MPANNYHPMTCVPEVSLLDPNEMGRVDGEDKISYKLWKKHKNPAQKPTTDFPVKDPSKCCEDRISQLAAVVEQQRLTIDLLRNENQDLRRDYDDMKQGFLNLSQRMNEMTEHLNSRPIEQPRRQSTDASSSTHHSGRWSLPGSPAGNVKEFSETAGILVNNNSIGRAPPDKSQLMNNLFRKYFPQSDENVSPSNQPIFEYNDQDKSMATFDYLSKYKLLGNNDRVLDGISKLKKPSRALH